MPKGRPRSTETLADKLRRYAPAGNPEECWLWTGACDPWGYGQFWNHKSRRLEQAHRIAYKLFVGPIPGGVIICHSCDTPACVNPAHLFLATHWVNKIDSVSKLRHAHGATHACAVLRERDVRRIRRLRQMGLLQREIAALYPAVTVAAIVAITTGRTWRWLK